MIWELIAALVLGVAAVWFLLAPISRPAGPLGENRGEPHGAAAGRPDSRPDSRRAAEPYDPEETERSRAVEALREIEFDRATGKLSDDDYDALKARYTAIAVRAIRQDRAAAPDDAALEVMIAARRHGGAAGECVTCGPRPEAGAVYCSSCGLRIPTGRVCAACSAILPSDGLFCEECGVRAA